MIKIRRASERGHAHPGWLDSWHTFSFANYYDPAHMGFRCLRVINDDRVAPGKGFGAHAHRDMEIISYVLEGSLAHKDSTGESHVVGPNTIQAMSAGTGIVHSEFNPSEDNPVHFLQIWIEPAMEDVAPSYQQISFDPSEKHGKFKLLAGPHPHEKGSGNGTAAVIHQDARVYAAELGTGATLAGLLKEGRFGWVQVARGSVAINGEQLHEGDGAALDGETKLLFTGKAPSTEFLFFDLP
jgi:quercetin 2,3-dioxygenase